MWSTIGMLRFASSTLLIGALFSLLLVAERVVAALWQWYKFLGYETIGVITLSSSMALVFVGASTALVSFCLMVKSLCVKYGDQLGARLAQYAIVIACVSFLLYWATALSPLNEWR